ncbi:hypothetical protein [Gilvimarinus sp. DA14]|uniref:hypothetical protein n=1 Tax=Gilvimarinus sp. DA14 TaxID=2956798 RepID=UPI0020B8CC13|nr:hypothetical protein [Gilvimarinus sp. DA14]UTF60946.1 hypothetical protein NHM04_03865 [Gilvimarinus sp. DA14]
MTALALIALITIALVALAAVNAINVRQQQLKQLARRREQLYQTLEQTEEALEACLQAVESTATCSEIAREKCALLEALLETEQQNPEPLKTRLAKAQAQLQQLSSGLSERELNRLCHSDSEIKMLQGKLLHALRHIQRRHAENHLTPEKYLEHCNQIEWARLMISVLSLVGAGYLARDNEQQISAINYFRKAQELLQGSQHPDSRRLPLIREISQLMQQNILYLSDEFFPEYTSELTEQVAE